MERRTGAGHMALECRVHGQVVGVPRAALPGVLLEVGELAEGFLTEVTTVGLGP